MTFQSVRGSVFHATEQEQHKQGPKVWVYSAPPRTKSKAMAHQRIKPYTVNHTPIPSPEDAATSGVVDFWNPRET